MQFIRYLGYGESPHGGLYVLSEWIDGRPLHVIARPGERRFAQWLRHICEAIQAVHNAGLVHGNLTPANILIGEKDKVTITDFGFAQASVGATSPILGGTLGFAAPEQIDPAFGTISPRTDIYAIGGLIHWYLTSKAPNEGHGIPETLLETIKSQRSRDEFRSQSDVNLRTIMRNSLLSSPADRTATIEEIIQILSDEFFVD